MPYKQDAANNLINEFANHYPIHEITQLFFRFIVSELCEPPSRLNVEDFYPGFTAACTYAFIYELNHLNEDLSLDVIRRMHHHTQLGLLHKYTLGENEGTNHCGYRGAGYTAKVRLMPGQNLSKAGLEELSKDLPDGTAIGHIQVKKSTHHHLSLVCDSDSVEADMANFISEYLKRTNKLQADPSVENKLVIKSIVALVGNLERLLPFGGQPSATLSLIVLNRELVRHGLNPTIMDNPSQFIGYSKKELTEKVIEGQNRYLEILNQHRLTNTPFKSTKVSSNSTKVELSKQDLLTRDLTNLEGLIIEEHPEKIECKPLNHWSEIVHRLVIESVLKKIDSKDPSPLTKALVSRIETLPIVNDGSWYHTDELGTCRDGFGQFISIFHQDNLSGQIKELNKDEGMHRILTLKALYSGADILFEMMPEKILDYISKDFKDKRENKNFDGLSRIVKFILTCDRVSTQDKENWVRLDILCDLRKMTVDMVRSKEVNTDPTLFFIWKPEENRTQKLESIILTLSSKLDLSAPVADLDAELDTLLEGCSDDMKAAYYSNFQLHTPRTSKHIIDIV